MCYFWFLREIQSEVKAYNLECESPFCSLIHSSANTQKFKSLGGIIPSTPHTTPVFHWTSSHRDVSKTNYSWFFYSSSPPVRVSYRDTGTSEHRYSAQQHARRVSMDPLGIWLSRRIAEWYVLSEIYSPFSSIILFWQKLKLIYTLL